jgi:hypothetical protein
MTDFGFPVLLFTVAEGRFALPVPNLHRDVATPHALRRWLRCRRYLPEPQRLRRWVFSATLAGRPPEDVVLLWVAELAVWAEEIMNGVWGTRSRN